MSRFCYTSMSISMCQKASADSCRTVSHPEYEYECGYEESLILIHQYEYESNINIHIRYLYSYLYIDIHIHLFTSIFIFKLVYSY